MLDKIVDARRLKLKEEMTHMTIEGFKQRFKGYDLHSTGSLFEAIYRKDRISIIAEVKKASPSKGLLREVFDPVQIAKEYAASGIEAISVLTEEDFFLGKDEYLARIKQQVATPILRKDFIVDLWQVYQSRFLGADAILLIVSILSDAELRKFQAVAGILGMQCLVEVHDRQELERALKSGAKIIGINNRNLKTFDVDLETTATLVNYVPKDRAVVSESGINSYNDISYLKSAGVDAVLIGEAFMRAASIKDKVNELRYGSGFGG